MPLTDEQWHSVFGQNTFTRDEAEKALAIFARDGYPEIPGMDDAQAVQEMFRALSSIADHGPTRHERPARGYQGRITKRGPGNYIDGQDVSRRWEK